MSELSPTSGGLPRAAAPADTSVQRRAANEMAITTILLVVVGLASLLVAEQIVTGWLALGERANIPRSNLNFTEIVTALGAFLWGLVTLRTAWGFIQNEKTTSLPAYFNGDHAAFAPGVTLVVALLGVVGGISFVIAEQVLTGWLALGERANIPRSNLNGVEMTVVVLGLLWGITCLRTVIAFLNRDRRGWAWAQWVVLVTAAIGATVLVSGMFDLNTLLNGRSFLENLAGVQELTGPGLLIFLSAMAVYRYLTMGVETTAAQALRNTLAKSPGAGAIIGFFALLIFFAVASDLFLEQRSLAGLLATNITRGIVAIGITFLMISGEFDLSVGSVFGAGALVFLLMMTEGLPLSTLIAVPLVIIGLVIMALSSSSGRGQSFIIGLLALVGALGLLLVQALLGNSGFSAPIVTTVLPAFIIALIFAALLGLVNGTILIATGIPSFIVTLGTLLAYRAILLVVVADGRILRYADYRLPPPFIYISRYLLAAVCVALALALAVVGFNMIRGAWNNVSTRLKHYRSDTGDFRDFYVFSGAVWLVVITGATLALLFLLLNNGALTQISLAATEPILSLSFFDLMNGQFDFVAREVNLRAGVVWWFALVLLFQFILTQTGYGNHVLAVGGNPGAARAQGINVNRVKILNFMICSMLACLAGVISVSRLANVDPLMGDGLELEVIAASVIGGALLTGGYGSIIGSLLGVLIFGMLQTGLVLIGVDSRAFSGVIGIIIIVAVIINTAVRQARK